MLAQGRIHPVRYFAPALLAIAAASGCRLPGTEGPVSQSLLASRHLTQQGVAAMEKSQWDQAEAMCGRAVQACPGDVEARRQYAEALWQRGSQGQAIAQMEEAVRCAKDDPALHVRLAEMRLATGATQAARTEAEQAIDLDPKSAVAWSTRAQVMRASGDLNQALADYRRALGYAPDDRQILLDIAEIYRKLNQPQRALTSLQSLAETYSPGDEPQHVFHLLGLAYMALNRNEDAVESLTAAVLRGPPEAELLAHLGEAQLRAGRSTEAAAAVEQALAVDPGHRPSRELLERLQAARPDASPLTR
jgi:tetratricopeptide (TPR) repeat protein